MRHGFLLIDKPSGPTSHDIVMRVRRVLGERSIGHLGTLDPLASGLLVLAVGAKALKVIELFAGSTKAYDADIVLGATSTTYDAQGILTDTPRRPGVPDPDISAVSVAIKQRLLGKIMQAPPAYSAVKVGGERAYRKARQGRDVALPEREVEIHACDIVSYSYPILSLHIECGAGTYIRSVAHDLGRILRTGGYLSALRRTAVAQWKVDDAVEPDCAAWAHVLPLKDVLLPFARLDLTPDAWEHIRHGRSISGSCPRDTVAWFDGLPLALLEEKEKGRVKARKVF